MDTNVTLFVYARNRDAEAEVAKNTPEELVRLHQGKRLYQITSDDWARIINSGKRHLYHLYEKLHGEEPIRVDHVGQSLITHPADEHPSLAQARAFVEGRRPPDHPRHHSPIPKRRTG